MSQSSHPATSPPIDFDKHPLVPAVIVDSVSGSVLMIGFMNADAYRETRRTGRTHFWSRSRNKLWKKGETSGHEQIVHSMRVNCEDNALLITVEQLGAVCHTGHPTCFYRQIEDDESLTTITDPMFDPEVVYGGKQEQTALWYGALLWLKTEDLSDKSTTSRLLRTPGLDFASRIADELTELAGVLDCSHRHHGLPDDLLTEGSQSLYWLGLHGVSRDLTWEEIRPDRALDTTTPDLSPSSAASLLNAAADRWKSRGAHDAATIHETIALVAQAAASLGVDPRTLIDFDLAEMHGRDYLKPYFESK